MKKQNLLKILGLAVVISFFSIQANAQTDPSTGSVVKQGGVDYSSATAETIKAIRVIDNKGTIKYLQSNNGITMITNAQANGDITTTTWQLGGQLTDDTYIDIDGNVYVLDGLKLVDTNTLAASTDATSESDHGTGTGWTILIRNEATGETMKTLASDIVQNGHEIFTATTNQTVYSLTVTTEVLKKFEKIWVYRNGAKLLAGIDYTVATSNNVVTLVPNPGTGTPNWSVYAGDIIEVQYSK